MPEAIATTPETIQRAQALWSKCYTFLSTRLSEVDMKRWIDPIEAIAHTDDTFLLRVPSEQFCMALEERFGGEFSLLVTIYLGTSVALLFEYAAAPKVEKDEAEGDAVAGMSSNPLLNAEHYRSTFNASLSFDTFYESPCNLFARRIGESIALHPGQTPHNIFFVHGPSGVGKTHLVQAIGQRALEIHKDIRVCYISSATFQAQYVHDARYRERSAFIAFYQQMDILIIDDIQGLIGKDKTQQAFFEIFNHLYLLGKQIILTSDVPPVEFRGIEDRILSRIQSSLTIPLERPDLELRRKILRSRMADSGIQLGEEVVELIATNMQRNVRELDGAVKTLITYAQLQQSTVDMNLARTVMGQSISLERREITSEVIFGTIEQEYRVDKATLLSATRRAEIVLPRQLVMYLLKKYTDQSLMAIARYLNRKNHTTVMHGIEAIENRVSTDESFRNALAQLEERLIAG